VAVNTSKEVMETISEITTTRKTNVVIEAVVVVVVVTIKAATSIGSLKENRSTRDVTTDKGTNKEEGNNSMVAGSSIIINNKEEIAMDNSKVDTINRQRNNPLMDIKRHRQCSLHTVVCILTHHANRALKNLLMDKAAGQMCHRNNQDRRRLTGTTLYHPMKASHTTQRKTRTTIDSSILLLPSI